MEPKDSLPHLQAPATCLCAKPEKFIPCLPIQRLQDAF
jgi:hypothetical protein